MNLNFIGRVCRIAAIGAILFSSASCLDINERLGENLIPTDQLWDVFIESAPLEDVVLKTADSLSAYSNKRFTFGSIYNEELGLTTKSTSFTLVPVVSDIDFGENTVVRQFRFNAVRDTLSTMNDNEQRMLQNVYVYSLKKQLDSTVLYTNALNLAFSMRTKQWITERDSSISPSTSQQVSLYMAVEIHLHSISARHTQIR